jgi:plasmid stabilization system protein ParE
VSEVELFVRHEAEIDGLTYFEYIRHRNPDAALRFLAAIDSTVSALAKQPLMGRPRGFEVKTSRIFAPGA